MSLVSIFVRLVEWIFEAAMVFNSTPEGEASLNAILTDLEAAGVDVPFWQPEGQPLDMTSTPTTAPTDQSDAQAFMARHPEMFPQEGRE